MRILIRNLRNNLNKHGERTHFNCKFALRNIGHSLKINDQFDGCFYYDDNNFYQLFKIEKIVRVHEPLKMERYFIFSIYT